MVAFSFTRALSSVTFFRDAVIEFTIFQMVKLLAVTQKHDNGNKATRVTTALVFH
jgi:hypothetical protein